jgi:hypothetical protein
MIVEKVEGEEELEVRLKSLKDQGIRVDQIIRKENEYVLIYEDQKILNEG